MEGIERVCQFLDEAGTYYLATVEGDQPRVRPFGTILLCGGKLYIQTGKVKDVSKLAEYKKEIDNLVTKKAKIAGDSSPQGSYLRDLIEERKSYENQLNSGAEYVKAPISGLVSYRVDGLEETLTPENFEMINEEYLENLNIKTRKNNCN